MEYNKSKDIFTNKLHYLYEAKVALAENDLLKRKGIHTTGSFMSARDRAFLYNHDKELQKLHTKFLTWMHSTQARFLVSRLVIADFYAKKLCTLTSLQNDTNFTRNAIADIIKTSVEAGWIYKKNNDHNKKEVLILPTNLRIKFWSIYCKVRFLYHKEIGLHNVHRLMSAYYDMENIL